MITLGAAKALGIEETRGSIAQGKIADLVLYDGDCFEQTAHVTYTLIEGRIVFDRADYLALPFARGRYRFRAAEAGRGAAWACGEDWAIARDETEVNYGEKRVERRARMRANIPRGILEVHFDALAQDYLRKLKPEHFMEATSQATRRKITLESFDLVATRRPDIQLFNELLVQYPIPRRDRPGQVVPDNMVVVHPERIKASGHFTLRLQPAAPFWVMEYVSNSNKRKDYVTSMNKYENQLKVPYYLLFYPDNQELSLFRHNGEKYLSVLPDEGGLHPVPELEMAVALVEGWVRFWFRGTMLPLPGDLQRDLDQKNKDLDQKSKDLDQARQELDAQRHRVTTAEQEALAAKALVAQLQAEMAALRRGRGEPAKELQRGIRKNAAAALPAATSRSKSQVPQPMVPSWSACLSEMWGIGGGTARRSLPEATAAERAGSLAGERGEGSSSRGVVMAATVMGAALTSRSRNSG